MMRQNDNSAVPGGLTEMQSSSAAVAQPHPDANGAGPDLLRQLMPEITELARKVGGFAKLAQIAQELDRAGPGQ